MAEANAVTPLLQTAAATQEKAKLRTVLARIDAVYVRRGLLAPATATEAEPR